MPAHKNKKALHVMAHYSNAKIYIGIHKMRRVKVCTYMVNTAGK